MLSEFLLQVSCANFLWELFMKRFSIFLVLLAMANFAFSQTLPKKLAKQFEDTGLFYITYSWNGIGNREEDIKSEINKFHLLISYDTKETFMRGKIIWLNEDIFPEKDSVVFEDVKSKLKECKNIFAFTNSEYLNFRWNEGRKLAYSVMYSQQKYRQILAAGVYVFRIFIKDAIYTIKLSDPTNVEERNADYDALTDYLYFNEGIKRDMSRGIEGTRGYYFIDEDAADSFYQKLIEKDASLPESALRFQEAAECIETILKNYK